MMKRPEIAADRLAVVGGSRGGELALQLGSMYKPIKAVVAYVPANVRYPSCCRRPPVAAWTWQGQPLAWASPRVKGDAEATAHAAIQVERTLGPVLLVGGEDDGVWPSAEMVDAVAARLRDSHFAYPVVVLNYPHAGHHAGMPEIMPAWRSGVPNPLTGVTTDFGGSSEGNAESSLDSIPKVLDFLSKNLNAEK